jgi:hypothetical protein
MVKFQIALVQNKWDLSGDKPKGIHFTSPMLFVLRAVSWIPGLAASLGVVSSPMIRAGEKFCSAGIEVMRL